MTAYRRGGRKRIGDNIAIVHPLTTTITININHTCKFIYKFRYEICFVLFLITLLLGLGYALKAIASIELTPRKSIIEQRMEGFKDHDYTKPTRR